MVVRGMVLAGAIAAGIGAGPALAQGAAPGAYGGGFIEFLMTGQDPGAVARPRRPAPVAPDGTIYATDTGTNKIHKITAQGQVSTFAEGRPPAASSRKSRLPAVAAASAAGAPGPPSR